MYHLLYKYGFGSGWIQGAYGEDTFQVTSLDRMCVEERLSPLEVVRKLNEIRYGRLRKREQEVGGMLKYLGIILLASVLGYLIVMSSLTSALSLEYWQGLPWYGKLFSGGLPIVVLFASAMFIMYGSRIESGKWVYASEDGP